MPGRLCIPKVHLEDGARIPLEDLATEFNISRERIRQIEVRAFEKLQKTVRDKAAALKLLPHTEAKETV